HASGAFETTANKLAALPPTSEPRQAPLWYRVPLDAAPTMLITDSPGRLVLARRDHDRASSCGKRAPDPETEIVHPIVGGAPVAVGRAEHLRSAAPGTAADDTVPAIASRPRR